MRKQKRGFSLRKTAKLVNYTGGLIKFTEYLRNNKYVMKDLEPYQEYIDRGYFTYSRKYIKTINRQVCVTEVTIKGLYYFSQKFANI